MYTWKVKKHTDEWMAASEEPPGKFQCSERQALEGTGRSIEVVYAVAASADVVTSKYSGILSLERIGEVDVLEETNA